MQKPYAEVAELIPQPRCSPGVSAGPVNNWLTKASQPVPGALLPSEAIYPWSSCLPGYIYIYIYTRTQKATSAPVWMP